MNLVTFFALMVIKKRGRPPLWAIGMIGGHEARSRITSLLCDDAEVEIYLDRKLRVCRVRELAEKALGEFEL